MYFIYTLTDPRTSIVAYVGMTRDIRQRYAEHIGCLGKNEEKNAWIKQMYSEDGIMPSIQEVDTAETEQEARRKEEYWIRYYAKRSALLNQRLPILTPGRKNTPEPRDPDILTTQEVAEILGVDDSYVRYLNRTNQLISIAQKTIKQTPRLKYRRSDVQAFMEKREQEAKEEDFRRLQPAS